jgi:hypothetical protein
MDYRPLAAGGLRRSAYVVGCHLKMRRVEVQFAAEGFPAFAVAHQIALLHAGKVWMAFGKANS